MTTNTQTALTRDGYVVSYDLTYATARAGSGAGQAADITGTDAYIGQRFDGTYYWVYRGYLAFDFSGLGLTAQDEIRRAYLTLVPTSKVLGGVDFDVYAVLYDWSAYHALTTGANATGAFQGVGNNAANRFLVGNTSAMSAGSAINSVDIDPTFISKGGITHLALISSLDLASTAPTVNSPYITIATDDHATSAYRPTLTIEYVHSAAKPFRTRDSAGAGAARNGSALRAPDTAVVVTRDIALAGAASMTATRDVPTAGAVTTTNSRDEALAGAVSMAVSRDIPLVAAVTTTGSRDVPLAGAITAVVVRDVPTAGAVTTTNTRDQALAGGVSQTATRDVATAAAVAMGGQRDVPLAGAATAPGSRDIPLAGAVTTTVSRDLALAGGVSIARQADIATAGAVGLIGTRDLALAGAATAPGTRDVALAGAVSATVSRDLALAGTVSEIATRDVPTAGAVSQTGTRDQALAGAATAPVSRDLALAGAVSTTATRSVGMAGAVSMTASGDVALAGAAARTATRDLALGGAVNAPGSRDVALASAQTAIGKRDVTLAGAVTATVRRDQLLAGSVGIGRQRDIALAGAVGGTATIEAPPYVPSTPRPILRLYEGSFLDGAISLGQPSARVSAQAAAILGTSALVGWDTAVGVGDLLTWGAIWSGSTVTITVPAGWTQAGTTLTVGNLRLAMYYRTATSADVGATYSVTFSGATAGWVFAQRAAGITTTSPLDKTASASQNDTSGAANVWTVSATPATLATAPELTISLAGVLTSAGPAYIGPNADGTTADLARQSGGMAGHFGHRIEAATAGHATAMQSLTLDDTLTAASTGLLVATFKGIGTPARFAPVGQFDVAEGRGTSRPYESGEFSAKLYKSEPLTAEVREGSIIEFWIPPRRGEAGHTFEWYVVRHLEDHDDEPAPYLAVSGPDLRSLVNNYPSKDAVIAAARSSPPAVKAIENWVRALITATVITPTASNDYATTDGVPGLALEAASGNRGTVYTDPPFKAGAPLGETISNFYKADGLGWRIVVKNPGTTSGVMEIQTYAGTDRRAGQTGEAVLASKWDTAGRVTRVRDAVNAVTALTLKGPANLSTRSTYYVEDAATKAKWGLIHGEVDAQNADNLSAAQAAAYLAERRPREWVEVTGAETAYCRPFVHYGLVDIVTAITDAGIRYDGQITAITLYTTGSTEYGSAGWNLPDLFALPDAPEAAATPRPATNPGFSLVIGNDPTIAPDQARTKDAAALAPYTYLPGLTVDATKINRINGFTGTGADLELTKGAVPGTVSPGLVVVADGAKAVDTLTITTLKTGAGTTPVDDGATRNPPKGGTGAAALTGSTVGARTINDVITSGGASLGDAAAKVDVQSAINAIQAAYDDLATKYATLLAALKQTGGGAKVIND